MSDTDNVKAAIQAAASKGHLTPISSQTLIANLQGSGIPKTLGIQIPLMESVLPLIFNLVIDISGSLSGYEAIVVNAINAMLEDIEKMRKKTGQETYVRITVFSILSGVQNVRVIRDFVHVQDCVKLEAKDYVPDGWTPLYEGIYDGVIATSTFGASAFSYGATGVQEVTVILSDGHEYHPKIAAVRTNDDVRSLLGELNSKPHFTVAFVGIGNEADFRQIALDAGIPDGNIITVDKSLSGITRALLLVSSSMGAKSQGMQSQQAATNTNFFTNI